MGSYVPYLRLAHRCRMSVSNGCDPPRVLAARPGASAKSFSTISSWETMTSLPNCVLQRAACSSATSLDRNPAVDQERVLRAAELRNRDDLVDPVDEHVASGRELRVPLGRHLFELGADAVELAREAPRDAAGWSRTPRPSACPGSPAAAGSGSRSPSRGTCGPAPRTAASRPRWPPSCSRRCRSR